MSPIIQIHGFWKCESHLSVLNTNANDIQKVLISFDPFLISYRPTYRDHETQIHLLDYHTYIENIIWIIGQRLSIIQLHNHSLVNTRFMI